MKSDIESGIFYVSYMKSAMEAGFTREERGVFYDGIITYMFTNELPEYDNPVMRALFAVCRPNIDATQVHFRKHQICKENGKRGGAPKGNSNASSQSGKAGRVAVKSTTSVQPKTTEVNNPKTTQQNNLKTTEQNNPNSTEENNPIAEDETTINKNKNENKNETINENENVEVRESEPASHTPTPSLAYSDHSDLVVRQHQFFESLKPYIEQYGKEEIQRFFNYWSETTPDGMYMRFEKEKYWRLPNRLAHW